ncbi:dTDP-4-dehydrorhamnose reductase [Sneathiella sp. P13V-1]|uniref:dTDP-4-dehydrorhamnose reductase n=1 Tax=Sneathiella sp. P13V-1 TaxID=2697366 RepID=UPI00187B70C6|nr:dTDP-4-dehydrorhamnose reductase [Sneathiella sp. P13V-1]MBE7637997.1 dTDP-4-dehydrorhamnose reductase [Sneathiella sp. P13V-1]
MKILVTGANGQVGQALATLIQEEGLDAYLASREQLDITDYKSVSECVKSVIPDVIINAAAYTAVDRAEEEIELAYAINRDGSENLAKIADEMDCPLLHISTDFVFDGGKAGAYLETDATGPLSIYGKSKLEGEQRISASHAKHIILRTAWVFGGPMSFVKTMKRLAEDRTELSVVEDQFGGPTPAKAIAESLLKIAKIVTEENFSDWGVYHYCGKPRVSWYQFASEILKSKTDVTVKPIPTSGYPTPAKRPANSVLDCSKIKNIFGIDQPDWKAALKQEG